MVGTIIYVIVAVSLMVLFIWWMKRTEKEVIAEQKEREQREKEWKEAEHRRMMEETERLVAMGELLIQSQAVGDVQTYEQVAKNTYTRKLPTRSEGQWVSMYDNLMIVKIAGINYRGNLSAYVGKFKGVLKPEPKNDYDPNAIMVKCEDGKHFGYVSEDLTAEVRAFIGTDEVDFKPYRIMGEINEGEDVEGKMYFYGRVFIVKKDGGKTA